MIDQHSDHPHSGLGGIYLTLRQAHSASPYNRKMAPFPIVAFTANELSAAIDRLQSHHIDLPGDVEEDRDSRCVMFNDPGRNLIELAQLNR